MQVDGGRQGRGGRGQKGEPADHLYGHIRAVTTCREARELLRSLQGRFSECLIVVRDNFIPHHKRELREWAGEQNIALVSLQRHASWLNVIAC